MADRFSNTSQVSNEVQRQFLRRTPIKLKQFSRLLSDMVEEKVDPLRVKALVSQVNKTREACILQGYDSTAKLLNKLGKQLVLKDESLGSQKPLLKRLSTRLMEHSEKLELGVKPQKQELSHSSPSSPSSDLVADQHTETEQEISEKESIPFFLDGGKLIFVMDDQLVESLGGIDSNETPVFCNQLKSLGIDCIQTDSLENALRQSDAEGISAILASLSLAEDGEVLDDEAIEIPKKPLIFIADEDNQANRAKAIRNGATGFIVKPISFTSICEELEKINQSNTFNHRRILVMEDSKAQAKYYQKVLAKGAFEVLVINDPSVLLEALRGFDPECVLMDMQMPGSSGVELTQIIRQLPRYAHLPVIFLSAEESQAKKNQALLSGGTAFIVKPVQKDQLMFMCDLYSNRYRELKPQIEVNPDTHLPYSDKFRQIIAMEAARASRTPVSMALAVIHFDEWEDLVASAHFSFINSATQQLALMLSQRLRKTDIVGQLEGGRIGVILTSGKQSDWMEVMQAIQQAFSELDFQLEEESKLITLSVGLSPLNSNYNAHQWIERSLSAQIQASEKGLSEIFWVGSDDNS